MTYRHFNNETTRSSVLKAVADTENEVAWARFFDFYAGFVFSIARSKGLKEEDADDIVQVVFVDLVRMMPTFFPATISIRFASGSRRNYRKRFPLIGRIQKPVAQFSMENAVC